MKNFLKTHALFLFILALVLLVALPILTYPMGRDQGMYANIGRVILAGGTPFVSMWDQKPPAIYYLYALTIGIFGRNTEAIRALDLVLIPLAMLGLYLMGMRLSDKKLGLIGALLFGVFYFNDGFQNLSQSDSLATIPSIWTAYFALRARQALPHSRETLISAFITGGLSGLLLWFKPQYAVLVLVFVAFQVYARFKTPKAILIEGAAFAVGGLLIGGGLLAYFAAIGVLQEIMIVAGGTAAYNAQGYDFAAFIANMSNGFYYRWIVWHGLIILLGLWFVLALLKHLRKSNPEAYSDNKFMKNEPSGSILYSGFILLWLLAGLAFAFIQAKGFDTHWFPMLPPMALLGAAALIQTIEWLGRSIKKKVIAFYAISVIVLLIVPAITTWGGAWRYLSQQEDLRTYWDRFQANDLKPEESLLVANFLRERVLPGDSLFIWGFRPEVYYMADLWPATRFQVHFPLIAPWYPEEWKQNNVDILWAAMPPYVLVLEDDYMAWLTNSESDSHTLLQSYTELNNWLIANYERETQIGDFIIWKRKSQ